MGSFNELVTAADQIVLDTFAPPSAVPTMTIHPQSGAPDLTVPYVVKNPAFEDDYIPGSGMPVTYVIVFVHVDPSGYWPQTGDGTTLDGVNYYIFQVDTDREGGQSLRMRGLSA